LIPYNGFRRWLYDHQGTEKATGHDPGQYSIYEQEGLLTPARTSNGYRDYSEEDGGMGQ
jgi:hypothetical protein